jgi:hypothetical protein
VRGSAHESVTGRFLPLSVFSDVSLLQARISRIGKYRPASSSAASWGVWGIPCMELPRALSTVLPEVRYTGQKSGS